MTLEQAKERLTYINQAYDFGDIYSRDDLEAIDTALKALADSIPKEKVRKLYEDYSERIRYIDDNNFVQDDTYHEYIKICDVLLRLLGE